MRYLFGLILLFALSPATPALAKMYRWVDHNGGVHYGDTIPSQLSSQAASELNQRGILIKKPDAIPSPKQIKARKAAREQAKQQARRDRALLATYANEQEIDQTRDRRLRQIRQQIGRLTAEQATAQKRLTRDQRRVTTMKKANKLIPASLVQQIKDTVAELTQVRRNMVRKKQEMNKIRARFEKDKSRFRQLTRNQ